MNERHHPNDASILAYASGTLDPALALVVSVHLETCSSCQKNYQLALNIGGALLELDSEAEELACDFDQLWNKLQTISVGPKQDNTPNVFTENLPKALTPYLPSALEHISWQPLSAKVQYFSLRDFETKQSWVRLFKFLPGAVVPTHSHQFQEMSLVLQGAYTDELGSFKPGDLSDLDDEIQHSPVVAGDIPCIALIATDGNLLYKDMQYRLMHWGSSLYSKLFSRRSA